MAQQQLLHTSTNPMATNTNNTMIRYEHGTRPGRHNIYTPGHNHQQWGTAPTTWQPTSINPPPTPTTQTPTFDGRKAGRMGGAHFVKFEKIVLDREMS